MAKIKGEDEYYRIPDRAVKTWSDIRRGIYARNLGLVIRGNGGTTHAYDLLVNRLIALQNLYYNPWRGRARTDGGERPDDQKVLDEEAASELVNHATEEYQAIYEMSDYGPPNIEANESALWGVINDMAYSRNPALHRISRSRDVIMEDGPEAPPLQLGYRAEEQFDSIL